MYTFDKVDYTQLAHDWIRSGMEHSGIIVSMRRSEYALRDRILWLFDAYPDGIPNLYFHI